MASHHRTNKTLMKKIQVSYVIRDEIERCHRSGVNSLKYDPYLNRLYTAGRDSIIRIWNIKSVKDYVKSLAYASDREQVASAGLDRAIFLWDVNTLTALTASNNTVTTSSLNGSKDSIYSLAMNPLGTVIVSGSTEEILRVWDPRTCQKMMKLRGHSDNVKAIVINRDGTQCLSGGSDGTIRLWSLGQQRCVATFRVHDEGVWALQANEGFTTVYSAGRDRHVWNTDIRNPDLRYLICKEQAPVVKLELGPPEQSTIYVATTDSTVHAWPTTIPVQCTKDDWLIDTPIHTTPKITIKGGASIRQYQILNDKRHVLTKDTENNVALWDILQVKKVQELGPVDFGEEIKRRFKRIHVPNWFTVDIKTGMLTVHLEESDCFATWVSAKEVGMLSPNDVQDIKLNFGRLILQALLEHWPRTHAEEIMESDDPTRSNTPIKRGGNNYFEVPVHTPVIFSEVGGCTLFRLLCRDAGRETENMLLNETVPYWVTDITVDKTLPKFNKIPFFLQPHVNSGIKIMKKDRLFASDMLLVRKVIEHVYNKGLGQGSDAGSQSEGAANSTTSHGTEREEDVVSIAEEKVELLCNNQVLDPNMDLRTVKHFIWKQGGDLTVNYRQINTK